MTPHDLLTTAKILLASNGGNPAEVSRRRAVSSCYYALFHCLARECADLLIGGDGVARSDGAWLQVYRALDHNEVRQKCANRTMMEKFPVGVVEFAEMFVILQNRRHAADYDPTASFEPSGADNDVDLAEDAIRSFQSADIKHRRAFCACVLLKKRN